MRKWEMTVSGVRLLTSTGMGSVQILTTPSWRNLVSRLGSRG